MRLQLVLITLVSSALFLDGCKRANASREITTTERRSQHDRPYRTGASSAERFGMSSTTTSAAAVDVPLEWATPEGWRQTAPTAMRLINFLVEKSNDTECYFSVLPGAAGGIDANINRWRKQMGQPELGDEEIGELQSRTLFGHDATYVVIDGEFTGMEASIARPDYRLLGLIIQHRGHTLVAKMIGPRDTVIVEEDNFVSFCQSLRLKVPEVSRSAEQSAGVGVHSHAHTGAQGAPNSPLSWTVPAGWSVSERQSSMRLVTFEIDHLPGIECYITILPGSAGGMLSNLNRWRKEVGQPPLDATAFTALTRVPVLNQDAVYLTATGDYSGMGQRKIADAMTAGMICEIPDQTVFIKMIGPQIEVESQLVQFRELAESLRFRE